MAEKQDYSNRRFLLVDDEPFMLDVIGRMLRGYRAGEITKATDGAVALDVLRAAPNPFDCIIADFNMKPLNGLQLLQEIRCGNHAHVKRDQVFIMLTGHARSEVVSTALMLDVNGYLVKPVAATKLAVALERAFTVAPEIKTEDYYDAIDIGVTDALNDAEVKRRGPWVMLPKKAITVSSGDTSFISRVKQFGSENDPKANSANQIYEAEIKNPRRCKLANLKEKMVVGEDVEADDGTVLLRKGTVLTNRMIARLREFAAESDTRKFLMVGDPV